MANLFLKPAFDFDGTYFCIDESKIETLCVSDTYANYGQQVGADDAGDSLELLTQKAADFANSWEIEEDEDAEPTWEIGSCITAYDHRALYRALVNEFGNNDCEDLLFYFDTCEGFNYWDGHNYASVIVSSTTDENTHEIEDDEEIIARLNKAIENKEFVSDSGGFRTYRYADAEIVVSQFAGAWEQCTITLDNEIEE